MKRGRVSSKILGNGLVKQDRGRALPAEVDIMNTVTFHRHRLVSVGFESAKLLFALALLGLLASCSPEGYVYQEMGKETVPPPVSEVTVVEEMPEEHVETVEVVETEHIHGPGCGHYFYDGQWHEALPPEEVVGVVAEASPETLEEGVEIYPPLSTAPGYEPVEEVTQSPDVVVNVYEPDYYPGEPVVEEYYYYPATVYYYDYYYPYDPWDHWSFSFSYASGYRSYWGLSIGYRPYYWWRSYCWDPWWYSRWWCGFSYHYYPWWYYDYHHHYHYYDHHRDYYRDRYHDNYDHHDRDDGYTRDQRRPGPARASRPIVDTEGRRAPRNDTLLTAERSANRPLIPVSAERAEKTTRQPRGQAADVARSSRPVKTLVETPGRSSSRPVRAAVDDRGTPSLEPSLPRTSTVDSPRKDTDTRSVVNVSEQRREDSIARLPAETRETSVERLSEPDRTRSESRNDRSLEPARDYGFRLTVPSREQSTSRENTRTTTRSTQSRGVIVIQDPPPRNSPERRPVTVVPPETRRPVVTSNVRSGPTIISRSETTRSEPARSPSRREISIPEPARESPPPRTIHRSEPSRSAPEPPRRVEESRPRVEPPPRVERPSSSPSRSVSPPRPSVSRPPSNPRTVEPRSIAPPTRSMPRPEVRAPSRPSAPSMPRGSRPSGGGRRSR